MADTYSAVAVLIVVFVAAILARAIKITISSSWYKKSFAQSHRIWIDVTKRVFDPVKRKVFDDLDKHLKILNSDVVEIGIGPGTLVPEAFFYCLLAHFATRTASYIFFYWHEALRGEKRKPLVATVGNLTFMPSDFDRCF